MSKTLRVVLEIEVTDLDESVRKACAKGQCCPLSEIPTLADHSAEEVASVLDAIGCEEGAAEFFFGGSDVYAKFVGCDVISAEWKP